MDPLSKSTTIKPHIPTIVLVYTTSDSNLHMQMCSYCRKQHTHTHTYTHRAMLSPNVINAVKRLTSGYLFKSRHQTHSFFFFISTDHRSYCQGRKAPSDQLSGQLGQTRPAFSAQLPRSLSSFTEGACRASAVLRQDKAAHCQADNGQ